MISPFSASFKPQGIHLPVYDNALDKIKDICWQKMKQAGKTSSEYIDRIKLELNVIESMGYAGYFLVVKEVIDFCRDNAIFHGAGRGSAVGSLVCYLLGITLLDPLKHGLIFERFLNPERIGLPDIDCDISSEGREDVLDFIRESYGEDMVAQIRTIGRCRAKQAVIDSFRICGKDHKLALSHSKMVPDDCETLSEAIKEVPALKQLTAGRLGKEMNHALALDGTVRSLGRHAGGIIIADKEVSNYVPVSYTEEGVISDLDMYDAEKYGLIKFDFLGLKSGAVIDELLKVRKPEYDQDFSINDPEIYKIIAKGDSIGLFQMESDRMTGVAKAMEVDNFNDVVALNAIVRPPTLLAGLDKTYCDVKHGIVKANYRHEDLEEVLSETHGIMLYQEQAMQVTRIMAGFSMAEADTFRKGCGKKLPEVIEKLKEDFIIRSIKRGYDKVLVNEMWELLELFSGYAFNKSHAVAYSYLTAQTAFFKTYFYHDFMCATMKIYNSDKYRLSKCYREIINKGYKLIPPTSKSQAWTSHNGKDFLLGLCSVSGIGESMVKSINDAGKCDIDGLEWLNTKQE
ncbi:MAG TPA: DNA polymerase III subunit alpha [Epsilonproteobacteria bacterium]|nr:DNA polymerase III subunit alpha [Campylobacterota bacterium]